MSYDLALADRVRDVLADEPGVTEKKMFGGLAFLVGGHMAVAASGQGGLLLRADPARAEELLDGDVVTRFEMGGRSMAGWLHVTAPALETDDRLRGWVRVGLDVARSLPPK